MGSGDWGDDKLLAKSTQYCSGEHPGTLTQGGFGIMEGRRRL